MKSKSKFSHILLTPQSHFQLLFYEAVYRVLFYLHSVELNGGQKLEDTVDKYPFLGGYMGEIISMMPEDITWLGGTTWWQEHLVLWEQEYEGHLPLRALLEMKGFTQEGRTAFLLAGLMEEDSRFGTVFADIQSPIPHRRPSLGLIGQMLGAGAAAQDTWGLSESLIELGLVAVDDKQVPRSEWILRIPTALWRLVRGDVTSECTSRNTKGESLAEGCKWYAFDTFCRVSDLVYPEAFRTQLAHVVDIVNAGQSRVVLLRGSEGSDREQVMGALASTLDLNVLSITRAGAEKATRSLGPMSVMSRSLPVFTYDLLPGETGELPELAGYDGPVGILMGKEGGLKRKMVEQTVTLKLPVLKATERRQLWVESLEGHEVDDLDMITERFSLPGGYIRQAAQASITQAALEGRQNITVEDVRKSCGMLNRQMLDTLASPLDSDGTWASLVVNDSVSLKLKELEQRCRYRERLLAHLGPAFGTKMNRGVRALFAGPSGTGKTLAAKILAAELGMDLYRVDLASVVNKYIGETEKNLHRLFSVAEEMDVILLLDEGDSLLGSRTDVKSSNDRYANLETNYLLQRLEHYEGIVLITTNLGENIDQAFQRRMDLAVDFVPPEAEERLQLWRLHLPENHTVDFRFLEEISVRCDLTGGQIRNTAMLATLLALEESDQRVGAVQLAKALRSEYRKAGASFPLEQREAFAAKKDGVQVFLSSLS